MVLSLEGNERDRSLLLPLYHLFGTFNLFYAPIYLIPPIKLFAIVYFSGGFKVGFMKGCKDRG